MKSLFSLRNTARYNWNQHGLHIDTLRIPMDVSDMVDEEIVFRIDHALPPYRMVISDLIFRSLEIK